MRKPFILFGIFLYSLTAHAQLSIEECYRKAQANYPLIKQYNLIEQTKEYNLSNASKGYLPQLSLKAKASYQSEVTEIPIDIPGVKSLSKDQYNATLELNQIVWDGGAIQAKKENIRQEAETEQRNIEVTLYTINDRVNQLFFGILMQDAQIAQNNYITGELQRNSDQIKSYISNGVANQADWDAVKVEILRAEQKNAQLKHNRKAYLDMLSLLTGETIHEGIQLQKPAVNQPVNTNIQRPEMELYASQIKTMETRNLEVNASLRPKIGLFLTGGYGRPGLNMLENNLSSYYTGGINLSWNIGNFYTRKQSRQIIATSINSIQNQQETFLFNTHLDMTKQTTEIEKYRDLLKYDDSIIELRRSVRKASEVKLANGIITTVDLMRDINAEDLAVQDKIIHETDLLIAIYNLRYITNN